MAVVTGLTAERMLAIEASCVVDGEVVGGHLILEKHDGTQIDAGSTLGPPGPQGPQGLSAIPGEVKLWPNTILPEQATYGHWVWADGSVYVISEHPLAASHIGSEWRTFGGVADPGVGNFRVPDLRGLVAAGLDQMPGGSAGRANRMTRAEALTLAKMTGKERHVLVVAELARHNHGSVTVNVSGSISGATDTHAGHQHLRRVNHLTTGNMAGGGNVLTGLAAPPSGGSQTQWTDSGGAHSHAVGGSFSGSGSGGTQIEGGDTGHENVQPTVFVPYIVCLDG